MKILVLNGSPKGEYSITLQTCLFIMRHFREHSFSVIHVGAQIKSLETQVDKLAGENEEMHSRLHASNVAYEQLQADAEEAHEEIENLRDELTKAHATIDKLSNALVDRL